MVPDRSNHICHSVNWAAETPLRPRRPGLSPKSFLIIHGSSLHLTTVASGHRFHVNEHSRLRWIHRGGVIERSIRIEGICHDRSPVAQRSGDVRRAQHGVVEVLAAVVVGAVNEQVVSGQFHAEDVRVGCRGRRARDAERAVHREVVGVPGQPAAGCRRNNVRKSARVIGGVEQLEGIGGRQRPGDIGQAECSAVGNGPGCLS